jgi:hypothetical protein
LKGDVVATQGVARFDQLAFTVPGARATMHGTFNLLNYSTDMKGTLATTGEISDVTSGVKSLFLKALTPFLKHKKRAKILPFKITGPYGKVAVSLDL